MNGVRSGPTIQTVVLRAIAGHPVDVTSEADYIALYHVFDRVVTCETAYQHHRMFRKRVGSHRWRVFIVRADPVGRN